MSKRVSHEKREGNCRVVKFPGTDAEESILWNHEDCPVCALEQSEQRIAELERERDKICDLATDLAAEVTIEWSDKARDLCITINDRYALVCAAGEEER